MRFAEVALLLLLCGAAQGQQLNFAGLLAANHQGQFRAVKADAGGDLYLLLDEKDGVRVLKADAGAANVLATRHLGAAGDSGTAMALDAAGNVYLTGTTSSGALNATAGAAFGAAGGSFVAKLDANLNVLFVSFTGGERMAADAIAATPDAVFITGNIFAATLPATPSAIQQSPASGTTQNGFVECFTADGSALVYATYLTGQNGATAPAAIAADAADNAYIAGYTSASGYPTLNAVVAEMQGAEAGFLTRLTSAGDGIVFSTFVSGNGIDALALDAAQENLLMTGGIAPGAFPVTGVSAPLVDTAYQALVKMPVDGSAVESAMLLAPGAESTLAVEAGGDVWVAGALSGALLPVLSATQEMGGDFAVRVNAQGVMDRALHFGGLPSANFSYSSAPVNVLGITADARGDVTFARGFEPVTDSSFVAGERYDLPLRGTGALPDAVRDAVPTACSGQCMGAAGFVAGLSESAAGAAFALSADTLPNLTLRNLSAQPQVFTAGADQTATSGFSVSNTDCAYSGTSLLLAAGASCHIIFGFTAAGNASDGFVEAQWSVAGRDVLLTGYRQAAALSVSADAIEFGTQIQGAPKTARYLYLSNNSDAAIAHTAASLPVDAAFTLADNCPAILEARTFCQMALNYAPAKLPSADAAVLALDGGLTVLVTGTALPAASAGGAAANPNLAVTPLAVSFSNPVMVSGVSGAAQQVTVSNTGTPAFALTLGGVGTAILPIADGALNFGDVPLCEPETLWFKAAPLTTLSASATAQFGVAIVEDTGGGHGQPPSSAFQSTASASCADCWLGVRFTPTAAGAQAGTLTATTPGGGNAFTVALTGNGVPLASALLTPLNQDFGPLAISSTSGVFVFTLTNGTGAAISIGSAAASGPFSVASNGCGGTLAAGASCALQVAYAPTAMGEQTGTLSVTTGAGVVTSALSGYGLADPGVSFTPDALRFSNAATQTITVKNTGAETITIGAVTHANAAFASTSNCGTLDAGASCGISVSFTPGSAIESDVLIVPVTGSVGAAPQTTTYTIALGSSYTAEEAGLSVMPAEMDFGPQATLTAGAARSFTLTNLSAKALNIGMNLPRGFVQTVSTCGVLAAGASCGFTMRFVPESNGGATGSVVVTGDPGGGTGTSIGLAYLTGYGVGGGSLGLSGGTLQFGNVLSGGQAQQTITLTNRGGAALNIRRMTSEWPFRTATTCTAALAPGATCTATVSYTPVYQVESGTEALERGDAGTLVIESDSATGPDMVELSGGALPVNAGATAVSILGVTAALPFTVGGDCTANGGVLAVGAACTLQLGFAPTAAGAATGSVSVANSAGPTPLSIAVSGTGVQSRLTASAGTLNFGTIALGGGANLTLTLSNSGSATVSGITYAATGDFAITRPCAASALNAGAGCTMQLTFTPTAPGARTGTLTIASSDPNSPIVVALSGNAIAGGSFTLTAAATALTMVGGKPAVYAMTLTPVNGFTGTVALGCTPLNNAPYASCSVTAPQIVLGSGGATGFTITINTITEAARLMDGGGAVLCLLLPFWMRRRWLAAAMCCVLLIALTGCGGGVSPNIQITPPGSYAFQVTATSVSGASSAQSVNLSLTVQ